MIYLRSSSVTPYVQEVHVQADVVISYGLSVPEIQILLRHLPSLQHLELSYCKLGSLDRKNQTLPSYETARPSCLPRLTLRGVRFTNDLPMAEFLFMCRPKDLIVLSTRLPPERVPKSATLPNLREDRYQRIPACITRLTSVRNNDACTAILSRVKYVRI